jgi:hypothetical protein
LAIVSAISVAICAATDYARVAFDDNIVEQIADFVLKRKGKPLPLGKPDHPDHEARRPIEWIAMFLAILAFFAMAGVFGWSLGLALL